MRTFDALQGFDDEEPGTAAGTITSASSSSGNNANFGTSAVNPFAVNANLEA